MVPPQDNVLINTGSRSNNNLINPKTVEEQLLDLLRYHEESIHDIRKNQIDVNVFDDEQTNGIATVVNPLRLPILVTDIIATWSVPVLNTVNPVQLGASTVATVNNNPFPVAVTVTGGTVTVISVNGTPTGLTSGTVYIPAAGTLTITYTVAPALSTTGLGPFPLFNPNGLATITFGGRTFQLQYATGLFVATSIHGLQLDNTGSNSKIILTVNPGTAVHLEIAGTGDYRKTDRL